MYSNLYNCLEQYTDTHWMKQSYRDDAAASVIVCLIMSHVWHLFTMFLSCSGSEGETWKKQAESNVRSIGIIKW